MIKSVNFSMFCDSFSETYKNNFTYEGKRALFDYLEEYEESTGVPVELDTVALCCEYTEYASLKDIQEQYTDIKNIQDLEDNTQVIPVGSERLIIQNY